MEPIFFFRNRLKSSNPTCRSVAQMRTTRLLVLLLASSISLFCACAAQSRLPAESAIAEREAVIAESVAFALSAIHGGDTETAVQYLEQALDLSVSSIVERTEAQDLDPDERGRLDCALFRVQELAGDAVPEPQPESVCWPTMEQEGRAAVELIEREVGTGNPLYACFLRVHAIALERLGRSDEAGVLRDEAARIVDPADSLPDCMDHLARARAERARAAAE